MLRECTHCRRPFTPADLARAESKGLEADRKAANLAGIRFLYYHCHKCEKDDIFVDILARPGESAEDFERRKSEMETAVRSLPTGPVGTVVVPVKRT